MPATESLFRSNGYVVFGNAIEPAQLDELRADVERLRLQYAFGGGLRRLASLSRCVAKLAASDPIRYILERIGLPNAFLARSILFDKSPGSNWKVAWHQDTKIPIHERIDTPGFTAWSVKDGVTHAQPPIGVLENMRTLRLHLDNTPAGNGALRVVPSTHSMGYLDQAAIGQLSKREFICECAAGDILAMSPLLLHASSPTASATQRRVIHLDFANLPLPAPLAWSTG